MTTQIEGHVPVSPPAFAHTWRELTIFTPDRREGVTLPMHIEWCVDNAPLQIEHLLSELVHENDPDPFIGLLSQFDVELGLWQNGAGMAVFAGYGELARNGGVDLTGYKEFLENAYARCDFRLAVSELYACTVDDEETPTLETEADFSHYCAHNTGAAIFNDGLWFKRYNPITGEYDQWFSPYTGSTAAVCEDWERIQ